MKTNSQKRDVKCYYQIAFCTFGLSKTGC